MTKNKWIGLSIFSVAALAICVSAFASVPVGTVTFCGKEHIEDESHAYRVRGMLQMVIDDSSDGAVLMIPATYTSSEEGLSDSRIASYENPTECVAAAFSLANTDGKKVSAIFGNYKYVSESFFGTKNIQNENQVAIGDVGSLELLEGKTRLERKKYGIALDLSPAHPKPVKIDRSGRLHAVDLQEVLNLDLMNSGM